MIMLLIEALLRMQVQLEAEHTKKVNCVKKKIDFNQETRKIKKEDGIGSIKRKCD